MIIEIRGFSKYNLSIYEHENENDVDNFIINLENEIIKNPDDYEGCSFLVFNPETEAFITLFCEEDTAKIITSGHDDIYEALKNEMIQVLESYSEEPYYPDFYNR